MTIPILNILHKSRRRSAQYLTQYLKFCETYHDLKLKPKQVCIEIFGPAHGRLNTGRIHLQWNIQVPVGGGAFIEVTIYANNEAGISIEVPQNASLKNVWIVWQWFIKSYQTALKVNNV